MVVLNRKWWPGCGGGQDVGHRRYTTHNHGEVITNLQKAFNNKFIIMAILSTNNAEAGLNLLAETSGHKWHIICLGTIVQDRGPSRATMIAKEILQLQVHLKFICDGGPNNNDAVASYHTRLQRHQSFF
jgi:hypothetical protein